MTTARRRVIQLAFLGLFIVLLVTGKIQLWMGVFVLGVLASLFWSRLYCGWICPINTAMEGLTFVKKKSQLKSFKIPRWLSKPWLRLVILLLFFLVFVFVMLTGKKLPILPLLFAGGVILTLFFPAELWHRFLCPYGAILSLSSMKARHSRYKNQPIPAFPLVLADLFLCEAALPLTVPIMTLATHDQMTFQVKV